MLILGILPRATCLSRACTIGGLPGDDWAVNSIFRAFKFAYAYF